VSAGARVAVLGAGIMGSATALELARLGVPVTLFEREAAPFRGASRWNEGKIHLGFLYAADPSLESARALLDGGLGFESRLKRLTGAGAERATGTDDIYLVHRDSVASAEQMADYFERLAALVRGHPAAGEYLVDVSGCRAERLGEAELGGLAGSEDIVAGFRVPERSVDTNLVADAFVRALEAEPGVELACGQRVTGVDGDPDAWTVICDGERLGPYRAAVNALWEGRPAIDRAAGHRPDTAEQHRFRVSVFARTEAALATPSAVVAVGPFGDVKNYGGHHHYASWYPAGLLARTEAMEPPPAPSPGGPERERIAAETLGALETLLPGVSELRRAAAEIRVEGGWVYSQGRGLLDDPKAGVHRRSRHGISRRGSWFSVDTGKYSVALTRAEELARMVAAAR
jgi:glycine/D-amino acid oxidase-like deaminating enzyme